MASPREIFLRASEIFLRGVGHVPLAVPVLLHSHPFSALIHTISLFGSHFAIYHTQLYVHCCKYCFLASRCRKILRNFTKCVLCYAKYTKKKLFGATYETKFGPFQTKYRPRPSERGLLKLLVSCLNGRRGEL